MNRETLRRALATLGLLGGGLLVGALTAEVGLRVFARFGGELGASLKAHDPLKVLIEPLGAVGYRHHANAVQRYANGTAANSNSLGFRGPEITREKPAGVVRVVLLGGSTTHGWYVGDDETIAAHLQRALEQRAPGRRFEVINAALDGYDSYQVLERLRIDVVPLEPDIVILNVGINDVRNARYQNIVDGDERTLLWHEVLVRLRRERETGPTAWSLAKHYSLLIRLPGFLRLRMVSAAPRRESNPVTQAAEGSDTSNVERVPYTPDAADYFERNVRRAAEIAATAGARVVFSTPPSSLRLNFEPTARSRRNYWIENAERTAIYRDTLAARLSELAGTLSRAGVVVPYLRPEVPAGHFLDDAHLSSEGNRIVAAEFATAVLALLDGR